MIIFKALSNLIPFSTFLLRVARKEGSHARAACEHAWDTCSDRTREKVENHVNLSQKYLQLASATLLILAYPSVHKASNIKDFSPKYIKTDNKKIPSVVSEDFINKDWIYEQKPYHACPGYYKPFTLPEVTLPEISADSSELSKNGVSILDGNVLFMDDKQQISAQRALIERDDKQKKFTKLYVQGNLEYVTPKLRIISNSAIANLIENSAEINDPIYFRYYPRNGRGTASRAVLIKDKIYNLYDSVFTTCPPATSDWELHASEISIDPTREVGTAKNTTLYFYNMPIFYTPYLRFPTSTQRESGFLTPVYNHDDRYGYAVALPFYLNLAPNYDMTIAPRYMTKRDSQLLIEARYLNKYGLNVTNLEYLPDDTEFTKFREHRLAHLPSTLPLYNPRITNLKHAHSRRYALKIIDTRYWAQGLTTDINYHRLSDNQYFLDLPRSAVMRQQAEDHILQQAKLNYNYSNWYAEALAKGYQTLHTIDGPDLTEPYRILPGFTLKNNNIVLLPHVHAALESRAERFASPSNPKDSKAAEGQRYYMKPSLSFPFTKTYGYITPRVSANIRHYDLNKLSPQAQKLNYKKNQSYFTPIASVDSGLYFDKKLNLLDYTFEHTLEPRLYYLYIPKRSQNKIPDFDVKNSTVDYNQLFRDNDFSGYDRQSNANLLTAGFESRLLDGKNGQEYLKGSVAQAFYFQNRTTTICNRKVDPECIEQENPSYQRTLSPLITQLNYNLAPMLYGQAQWQWDYNLNTTRRINLGLHYIQQNISEKSPQRLLNVEYNFLKAGNIQKDLNGQMIYKFNNKRNNLSEVETSLKLPLTNNLVMLGFYSYDIRNLASLDRYLGIELQKCCWALRIGYKSQLRLRTNSLAPKKYDNSVSIQFSLKGLGELNQNFENILQTHIPGYTNQLTQIY